MNNLKCHQQKAWVFPLFFAALLPAALSAADPPAKAAEGTGARSVKDLARSAELVFRGTVQEPGAANLSIVEPNALTAVVRVDEVLKLGGTLDDFAGREITVFSSDTLSAGEVRIFFTRVRLLGESLGVQEVGRAAGSVAEVGAQVRSGAGEILREALAARLEAADLVVSGRVLGTRAAHPIPEDAPLTEHDPLWREAVLEVRSVLKGSVSEKTVTFRYPGSVDVMWARVPKPSPGQEGTWLLHHLPQESGAALFVAVDPQDLLSAAEETVAARLVNP